VDASGIDAYDICKCYCSGFVAGNEYTNTIKNDIEEFLINN
jgi:hypothetical protein